MRITTTVKENQLKTSLIKKKTQGPGVLISVKTQTLNNKKRIVYEERVSWIKKSPSMVNRALVFANRRPRDGILRQWITNLQEILGQFLPTAEYQEWDRWGQISTSQALLPIYRTERSWGRMSRMGTTVSHLLVSDFYSNKSKTQMIVL